MKNIVNNLVLELHIPHFDTARSFYKMFNFEEILHDPTSGGGSDLGYMVLRRVDTIGDTLINFYGDKEKVSKHTHFADFPENTPKGYAIEITVPVSNVESLWDDVKEKLKDNQISQELTLKRWGKKDFRVIDPFGFYIRFRDLVDWGQK